MKPFDKKFADDMRNAFDNWQEPVDEHAWLQMKQKLGRKSSRSVFIFLRTWPAKAAATIMLGLISFSIWYYLGTLRESDTMISQNDIQTEGIENSVTGNQELVESATVIISENVTEIAESEASEITTKKNLQLYAESIERADRSSTNQAEHVADLSGNDYSKEIMDELTISEKYLVEEADSVSFGEINIPDQKTETENLAISIPSETDSLSVAYKNDFDLTISPVVTPQRNDEQTIARNLLEMTAEKENKTRNSYVEVSAGSLKTYSSAELASGLGFSAGVMGHLAVSNSISFSSGGVLLYNQFTLDNPVAATGSRNLDESFAMPDLANDSYSNTLYAVTSNYTDFEFTAIDIPLNVRFKVSDRPRSQFFISGGLSSLLYLQQNYTRYTEYATESTQFGSSGSQEIVSGKTSSSAGESYDAFRQFDFGRLVNFSMGYLVKREKHSILIEPHIKYPIGNITSMDLRIGMAGISLKYNFQEK